MALDDLRPGNARPSPIRRWGLAVLATLLLATAATLAYLWWPTYGSERAVVDEVEDLEPPPRDPGYVGPHACTPCHADRVAEFLKTTHFQACRETNPKSMPPGFAPGKG